MRVSSFFSVTGPSLVQTLFKWHQKRISRVIDSFAQRACTHQVSLESHTEFHRSDGILHLVGVEVNHLEFEAPEGRAAHSIGAEASCITGQGEGNLPLYGKSLQYLLILASVTDPRCELERFSTIWRRRNI